MKSRVLKQILNNTGYHVNNNDNYIAVGSPMCHDLISVDKKTLKIKYALDTWNEGRKSLKSDELIFIWDKLSELIASGEIQDIINSNDTIENPLPVFTCEDGELIETFTDEYGWPNVTISGDLMYDNTFFKTKREAIDYGIEDLKLAIKYTGQTIMEKREELIKSENRQKKYIEQLTNLQAISKSL